MLKSKDKKIRFSITIDPIVNKELEELMESNLSFNKSKLIEKLISKYIKENKEK